MRRNTVPCSARMRAAAPSRRAIRSAGTLAEIVSACGTGAGPSSCMRAMTGVNGPLPVFSRSASALAYSVGTFAIGAGFGQHHRFRFDRSDGGNGVRPIGFDDRESARRAQGLDDIRRRAVGNDDERTLQRHGEMRTFFEAQPQPCQSAVNGASTDAVHFGFVIRDAAGRREPAGNVVPSVADHNKVTAE